MSVDKANTQTGVAGEVAARRYLIDRFDLVEGDVQLTDPGEEYDLRVRSAAQTAYLHVKSGLWNAWPKDDRAFGVHGGQGMERTTASLVLISMLRTARPGVPSEARVEGFITPGKLSAAEKILKGQLFPGMNYPSRTDNLLTYFRDYEPIASLPDLLWPVSGDSRDV